LRKSTSKHSVVSEAEASQDSKKKKDEARRPWAHINHLTVLPEHRGRGVGRMLFRELMVLLSQRGWPGPGSAEVRISVVERNAEVMAWYKRLGFTELSRRTVYPSNCPVNLIKMRIVVKGGRERFMYDVDSKTKSMAPASRSSASASISVLSDISDFAICIGI
jgi:hypothetical protein